MEEVKNLAEFAPAIKAIAVAIGGIFPALAIGKIGSETMKSIGRNPECTSKIQTPMMIAAAFAEGIALIYAVLIVFAL